jgi:hypothetical protein
MAFTFCYECMAVMPDVDGEAAEYRNSITDKIKGKEEEEKLYGLGTDRPEGEEMEKCRATRRMGGVEEEKKIYEARIKRKKTKKEQEEGRRSKEGTDNI